MMSVFAPPQQFFSQEPPHDGGHHRRGLAHRVAGDAMGGPCLIDGVQHGELDNFMDTDDQFELDGDA